MKPNDLPNSFASNTTDEKTSNNNESFFEYTKKVKVFLYYTETKDIDNGEILKYAMILFLDNKVQIISIVVKELMVLLILI
jgi:hypothetical protein